MNPKSGQEKDMNSRGLQAALISIDESLPLRKISGLIDGMAVSADVKALLMDIASLSIKIGERVVAIGRKIVSFALGLVKKFPNTTFGIVIALVLGALVTSAFGGIPIIGVALAAKLKANLLLFGIARGAVADISQMPLRAEVDSLVNQMAPLAKVA